MAQEARSTGVVRWFSDVKGYGFIKPDDGGDDLFVHQSSIKSDGFRTLSEGATVEYTSAYGDDKKPKAVDVTGLDGSSVQEVHGDSSQSFGSRRGPGFGGGWQRDTGGDGYGYGGGRGGGGGGCYQCGRPGHLARECPESSSFGGGGGGGGGGCYNCGQPGHFARECRSAVGGGGSGGGGGAACYSCGGFGHLARDCSQGSGGGGGGGNFGRYGGGASGGGGGCYNCGNPGHFARECTNRS